MSTAAHLPWPEANQRYLMAAVAVVREALERHAARPGGPHGGRPDQASGANGELSQARSALPAPAALEVICESFALSLFERDVLLLCAGVELEASFATRCATAQGDPRRPHPTFGLALAAFPDAHWNALAPAAPLRRWRLIEVGSGEGITSSPLRIDERILHFLTGVPHLDERLHGLLEDLPIPKGLPPSHRAIAERMAEIWRRAHDAGPLPIVQLCGRDAGARRAVVAVACVLVGVHPAAARAADLPGTVAEREAVARLWEREAILGRRALLLECDDADSPEHIRGAVALLERLGGIIVTGGREPLRLARRMAIRLDLHKPTEAEQRAIWERTLGQAAPELNGHIAALTAHFDLGLSAIQSAAALAEGDLGRSPGAEPLAVLWDACRGQARPRLDDLAQRIEPTATWDDLVLPEPQRQVLREIATHVRQRATVYETWGFAARSSRGLGISALFAGASGTGKTMAAEVLAQDLRLDLYRIDLSQVVSKYIGETEKNLRRVFDAAEEGGAILLFDEADALFGKRSEVKDSHDRYANIEVSYLLQRMEAYRGLAILTTNMKHALDPAFLRRIRFLVQFPFPDAAQRAEIWRRMFPARTPTEGLDVHKLARLNVAGGNIRNIALNAAFLAADAGQPVRMAHLVRAARSEYAKIEKPLTEAEIGSWT